MPVVVSDTSPVRALAHLGRLTLLRDLFGEVLVPPAVVAELASPKSHMPLVRVAEYGFIIVRAPAGTDRVRQLRASLDAGEAEALVLASEVGADVVLMDERDGRAEAERMSLTPLGALGVLVRGKRAGLIPTVRPDVDRLREELRFFISDAMYGQILGLAGET